MADERDTQANAPGSRTTNTPPSQGPDYNREGYYGGRQDEIIPAPHTGAGTRGYDISQEEAIRAIVDRLRQNPSIDPSNIEVNYDDGHVTLSGGVLRDDVRQQAEELARGVPGVKDVRNDLHVLPQGLDNAAKDQTDAWKP